MEDPRLTSSIQHHGGMLSQDVLHCHVSLSLFTTHTQPFPLLSLPKTPSFLLFSTALPSLSIPQVCHTEPHCVSGLGREQPVQPLTTCCHWTHLKRPQATVHPFHTHLASFCLYFLPPLIPSLSFISRAFIPFSSACTTFGNRALLTHFTLYIFF